MAYKPLPMESVALDDLVLDLANYRIPVPQDDEFSALNYLYASEDVYETARMIIRDGYFDNEVPIVTSERAGYTVLEGNRRVSALKVLHDPTLIPAHEDEVRALLKRYQTEAEDLPTRIRVLVAPSRQSASFHIARLHTTLPKRRWTRDQQATYFYSLLSPTMTVEDVRAAYPGINVPRFIRMAAVRRFLSAVKFKDRTLREYVKTQDLTMSSLEFAYKFPDIAAAVGISFEKDGHLAPAGKHPEKIGAAIKGQQLVALEYLMNQFRSGILNTRAQALRKGTKEQAELIAILTGVPLATAAEDGVDDIAEEDGAAGARDGLDPGAGAEQGDEAAAGPRSGHGSGPDNGAPGERRGGQSAHGPNHPNTKDRLVLTGLDYTTHVPVNLHNRYQELRKLSLGDTPVAYAMLLRAVLESTIKFHFEGTATPATGELKKCMEVVRNTYGPEASLRTAIDKIYSGNARQPGSVSWFNDIAHSHDAAPTPETIRQAFNQISPVLRRLLRPA